MSGRKYVLPDSGGIMIHGPAADSLIKAKSGDAALLYIYMLKMNRAMTAEEAAEALGSEDINRARRALDTLKGLGLVFGGEDKPMEPADTLPQYSYQDIKRELENGSVFPGLVDETQRVLGRILSSEELVKLFGIYDSLGLPPEVILQLVNYCVRQCRERYGGGRRVTMRFIEKEAYAWERAELFTIERAEEYIRQRENMRTAIGEYQRMLNITGRSLTPSERAYVENWIAMGFPVESAEIAYDKTIIKTNKLTWKYMDTILRGWHDKNLHTPEEIQPNAKNPPRQTEGQPAAGEDYERMKRMLNEIKGLRNP